MTAFPRAIAHIDADAFFASVEQALNPAYAGKPVVTGQERNIVAAASYEAKARGVKRGVALWDVKKLCPDAIILPSDYESYSLYSLRLFEILRRFSPVVEEASIDEGYIDLTGVSRLHRKSYRAVVEEIQRTVKADLGLGISIGLSVSKSIAKLASKYRKPAGITAVRASHVPRFLALRPASEICGIGPSATALLARHGIATAYDFARLAEPMVRRLLGKNGLTLWMELNGKAVVPFALEPKSTYFSIMKSKTFAPPSRDREFVRAHLIRNLESACIKAVRHKLAAGELFVYLRYNLPGRNAVDGGMLYSHRSAGVRLEKKSNLPSELIPAALALFEKIHDAGDLYRATGVVLGRLAPDDALQYTLFDDPAKLEEQRALYGAVAAMHEKYGKHVVSAGTSLLLRRKVVTARSVQPERKTTLLKGETARQRINIPMWKVRV